MFERGRGKRKRDHFGLREKTYTLSTSGKGGKKDEGRWVALLSSGKERKREEEKESPRAVHGEVVLDLVFGLKKERGTQGQIVLLERGEKEREIKKKR